jgi:uncharacterized protein YgbK (DUF1537 family)
MPPLLTFYGDDFTGSSAVMEVLGFAGVPTMLFLHPPDAETLAAYPDLRAIGGAGVARARDPDWMRRNLPPVLDALTRLGAPVMHYKVCSTFDSSPDVGSIGLATELGVQSTGATWVPLVVGAPAIGRYQAFGTLFAKAGQQIHRLDRHPVMARHPVTPMHEADLGRHLSAQTDLPVGIVDLAAMKTGQADTALTQVIATGAVVVALDVVDDETLQEAGRLIWKDGTEPVFVVGSQGVEYALVAHWRAHGILPGHTMTPPVTPVDQIFAVSGSCAPTTADQITYAEANGFEIVEMEASAAIQPQTLQREHARVRDLCLTMLGQGRDVLVTTARGPEDPGIARMAQALAQADTAASIANERLGQALGNLVSDIRRKTGLPRVAIGGGDTSGHALTALGADALSAVAPLAPGAPLCRIHSRSMPEMDGLEATLKGGQMGSPAFFVQARDGLTD